MNKWLVTFFGAGMLPKAPGTAGSLAAVGVLYAIHYFAQPSYGNWQIILAAGLIGISLLAIKLGPWANIHYGKKDPQPFVLDEVAGICLTALFQPIQEPSWSFFLAVFLSFRVFDILKLQPAKKLEHLPFGYGILLDDLAAAVYANLACQAIFRLFPQLF